MAMLTRLGRLAECGDGDEPELLRALSEDFEDYLDVVEAGGDEDAFVEARRKAPAEEPDATIERDWSLADPLEIPVHGLDLDRMFHWNADERRRAELTRYLDWVDTIIAADGTFRAAPTSPPPSTFTSAASGPGFPDLPPDFRGRGTMRSLVEG